MHISYLPQCKVDQEAEKSVRDHGYRHRLGAVVGSTNFLLRLPRVCDPHPGVTQHPGGVPQCPQHLGGHDAHDSSEDHSQLQSSTKKYSINLCHLLWLLKSVTSQRNKPDDLMKSVHVSSRLRLKSCYLFLLYT